MLMRIILPMTEAIVYLLTKSPWNKGFPKILESIASKGVKLHVLCNSKEEAIQLDNLIWTFEQLAFVPHALDTDPYPEQQPIIISEKPIALNAADTMVIVGEILPETFETFKKVVFVANDTDPTYKAFIKSRLNNPKFSATKIFKQTDTGWAAVTTI